MRGPSAVSSPKASARSISEASEARTEVDARERPARPQVVTAREQLAPPLRKIPSSASISAISAQAATPSTPALTPGGASAATDDEETDFQSAYSTSPRGSYGELDPARAGYDSEQGTPTTVDHRHGRGHHHLDEFGARTEDEDGDGRVAPPLPLPPKSRERNFSTSTATNAKYGKLKARGSEDTVGGRA